MCIRSASYHKDLNWNVSLLTFVILQLLYWICRCYINKAYWYMWVSSRHCASSSTTRNLMLLLLFMACNWGKETTCHNMILEWDNRKTSNCFLREVFISAGHYIPSKRSHTVIIWAAGNGPASLNALLYLWMLRKGSQYPLKLECSSENSADQRHVSMSFFSLFYSCCAKDEIWWKCLFHRHLLFQGARFFYLRWQILSSCYFVI